MNRLGFFVGHVQQLPQALFLIKTFKRHSVYSEVLKDYQLTMMVSNEVKSLISRETLDDIASQAVEISCYHSAQAYQGVPFLDKIEAAANFEQLCNSAYLWMDVDSCFIHPLNEAPFGDNPHNSSKDIPEIAVNPVDKRNIGDLYGQMRSRVWLTIAKHLGIEEQSLADQLPLTTRISNELIYPYYNVGMVWVNVSKALFQKSFLALENMLSDPDIQTIVSESMLHKIFIHQVVMSLMIEKLYPQSRIDLPSCLNYPLHLYAQDAHKPNLTDMVSIRYDDYFDENQPPQDLVTYFENDYQVLKSTWYY